MNTFRIDDGVVNPSSKYYHTLSLATVLIYCIPIAANCISNIIQVSACCMQMWLTIRSSQHNYRWKHWWRCCMSFSSNSIRRRRYENPTRIMMHLIVMIWSALCRSSTCCGSNSWVTVTTVYLVCRRAIHNTLKAALIWACAWFVIFGKFARKETTWISICGSACIREASCPVWSVLASGSTISGQMTSTSLIDWRLQAFLGKRPDNIDLNEILHSEYWSGFLFSLCSKVHVTKQTLELLDDQYMYEPGTDKAKEDPFLIKNNIETFLISPQYYTNLQVKPCYLMILILTFEPRLNE